MSRRALLIALIVSLAVNIFVLGGLAGAVLMGLRPHGGPPPGPPRLAAMTENLSPEHRDAWLATLKQTAGDAGPKLRQARSLRREAWRSLMADKPDAQAALASLDQSRLLEQQARSEMDRAVVTFAATLPPEERRKLGEALSRPRMRGPGGGPPGLGRFMPGERPLPDR